MKNLILPPNHDWRQNKQTKKPNFRFTCECGAICKIIVSKSGQKEAVYEYDKGKGGDDCWY